MKVTPSDSSNVLELRADSRTSKKAVAADPSAAVLPRRTGRLLHTFLWLILSLSGGAECFGQTAFLDFNTPGQYTNNFNPWNDNGGGKGGNYSFIESLTAGVGGGGGDTGVHNSDTNAA